MAKRFFRSLVVGIIVFAVAILAGYLSYVVTCRYQARDSLPVTDSAFATPVSRETEPLTGPLRLESYYLARLENDDISIYLLENGKESFLYTLDIYIGDLPEEDRTRLTEGIVLTTRQELASFEEDYNS